MRKLHVVALSEDGRHVVLATSADAKQGGFRLALDERLQAAVKGELITGDPSREPMTVREIQARLRAGESVERLVRSGGASLARVERFAGPVLSERAQVVEQARRAVLVRGRRGASALPLGEAVDLRLSELPSVRPDSVEWTAWKSDDGLWTVGVSWHSRGRTRTAQWRYDVVARTTVALDPASAALAHVDADGRSSDGDGSAPAQLKSPSRARAGRATTAAAATSPAATRRPSASRAARPAAGPDADGAPDRRSTRAGPGAGGEKAADGASTQVRAGTKARPRRGAATGADAPRGSDASRSRTGSAGRGSVPRAAGGAPTASTHPDALAPPKARSGASPAAQSSPHPSVSVPGSARPARGPSAGMPGTTARPAPAPFGPAAVAAVRRPPVRRSAPQADPVASVSPRVVAGEAGLVVPAPGSARRTAAPSTATPRRRRQAVDRQLLEPAQVACSLPAVSDEPRPSGPPSLRVVPAPYEEDEPAADVS